ncbi:MAG: alanine--tRNA ligase [Solirubrobacteraceae bacterium]
MRSMSSDETREAFLSFFEQRDHKRLPSGSLVPAEYDPSVLLTTAGMHPLLPYFLGHEKPPHNRLTTCQKCFRTTDIENVGNTLRHLTFFEMLGNFSIGDYFKQGAAEYALQFSVEVLGFDVEAIWVSVFAGDEELGLGPDEEAIAAWESLGFPRERIVGLSREDNFWQAGPTGPCGPCSELYLDRGAEFGGPDDRPGDDTERFLEYWNLVFMEYDQNPAGTLAPLPAKNIDTGLGLNRMAAVLQDVPSVFETDQFAPLMALGEELSGRSRDQDFPTTRGLRILADHTRGATFLIADGVVPSNEDRGYILRRIMRRAIQHGRSLGMAPGFMARYADVVRDVMGAAYPELGEQRESIDRWMASEEESFGRTLEQGTKLLDDLIARARESGDEGISSEDAFRLHDTYGFPIDLTLELVTEHGLGVDQEGFEVLMSEQRARARAVAQSRVGGGEAREHARALADRAGFQTDFVGYETLAQRTTVGAVAPEDGRVLVKLAESPFYAAGGGQVSDHGSVRCEDGDCVATVEEVFRLGDDQVVAVRPVEGSLREGERVIASVSADDRRATEANHTATHLLHAALRTRLGRHVRQAGSYVGHDKLRFDFTHGSALTPGELREVVDQVNAWVLENHPVRALTTSLEEAKRLGAMALFGEKYGEVVRMVEVGDGDFSRELCGGTHVRSTAEIGAFVVTHETSSAANVRRIEALTGPAAIARLRHHDDLLMAAADALRTQPQGVVEAIADLQRERKELLKGKPSEPAVDPNALLAAATRAHDASLLITTVPDSDVNALLSLVDQVKGRLDKGAIVLGSTTNGRVHLVASVDPSLVERGVRAGEIVKIAAAVTGGGGGGRDTLARAGGRDASKLPEALEAAREAIEQSLKKPRGGQTPS